MRTLLAYPLLHARIVLARRNHLVRQVPIPKEVHFSHGDAYLVEAHAAFEFFIEETCRRAVHIGVQKFLNRGVVTPALESLFECFAWHAMASYPNLGSGSPFLQGHDRLHAAVNWYVKNRVDKNNGIKRKDFIGLFGPLGFGDSAFSDILLDTMDSLGSQRGDAAHGKARDSNPPPGIRLQNNKLLEVWTPKLTQSRATVLPWNVDKTIQQCLPGLLEWDKSTLARC